MAELVKILFDIGLTPINIALVLMLYTVWQRLVKVEDRIIEYGHQVAQNEQGDARKE